jgi:pimeloyl-ACP methyl ester carboxylesterase
VHTSDSHLRMRVGLSSVTNSAAAAMIGAHTSAGFRGSKDTSNTSFEPCLLRCARWGWSLSNAFTSARNASSGTEPASSRISPDSYTVDQLFLDRPGNSAIQLDLLYDYQSNVAQYDHWHEYFRNRQPRMLILWGKNDPFFTVEGAKAYQKDLSNAQLHLIDTGHFALEDSSSFIAEHMREFLGQSALPTGATAA